MTPAARLTLADQQRLRSIRERAPLRTRMTVEPNLDHRFHCRLEDARLANELELSRAQARELFEDLQRFFAECERIDDGPDLLRQRCEVFR